MAGVEELMKSLGIAKSKPVKPRRLALPALEPEMAPPGSHVTIEQVWDSMVKQLKDLSSATVQKNLELERRVNELQQELDVWKQSRTVIIESAEQNKKQYEDEKLMLQKRITLLESMQGSMVLCVLDGDGNIFADRLIAAGLEGGREAARILTGGIFDYLESLRDDRQTRFSLWLSIYFNRKGLQDTLVKNNICSIEQFEAFLVGISQASPRFFLVDVGYGKEAADAKIKEYLQTYARFPQTLKVFFGGGHDNRYLPTLAALQNERLLDKIVLLKGYCDLAAELKALKLPAISLDKLFRSTKLITVGSPKSRFAPTPAPSEPHNDLSSPINLNPLSPGIDWVVNNSKGPNIQRFKPLDPKLPLTKQNPPPCNEFYLVKKCPRGDICKYGHAYDLNDDDIAQLRQAAKRGACPSFKRGIRCTFGSRCIYGHACPNGPDCWHFKQGKCWYRTPAAHGEPDSASNNDLSHSPTEPHSGITGDSLLESLYGCMSRLNESTVNAN